MVQHLSRAATTLSFGDVGRYGNRGATRLIGQSVDFLVRPVLRRPIDGLDQIHCLLPCGQIPITLPAHVGFPMQAMAGTPVRADEQSRPPGWVGTAADEKYAGARE